MASINILVHLSMLVLVFMLTPPSPCNAPHGITDAAVVINTNDTSSSSAPKPTNNLDTANSVPATNSTKSKRNETVSSYVPGSAPTNFDINHPINNDDDNITSSTNSNATEQNTLTGGDDDDDDDDEVEEEEHEDHPRFTMETFVTISVTLITVLSNCTIIIVAAWTEAFNNFNKIFIYSMSLADLLIGLFVTPYSIFLSVYRKWIFVGGTFCNIEAYVLLTLKGAKLFSLTWLNVDHYIAVRKPERYNVMMSKTRSVCWIIISWLAAICFFMPPMLSFKSSFFNRSIYLCQADTKEQIAYILTSVTLVSIPALLALTITNIYLFTPGYKKRIRFYEKVFVELSTRPWNYHITFVMCAVTVVLWAPFCLLRFFLAVSDLSAESTAEFYLCWLGFCCTFSNFLVLLVMCPSFRKAVWEMYGLYDWCPGWCCCCLRNRNTHAQGGHSRHHHRYSSDVNVITLTRKR